MTRPTKFDVVFAIGGLVFLVVVLAWTSHLIAHPPKPPTPPAVVVFP